jgi:hypothetical protein
MSKNFDLASWGWGGVEWKVMDLDVVGWDERVDM